MLLSARAGSTHTPSMSQPSSISSLTRGLRSGTLFTDTDTDTNTATDTDTDTDDIVEHKTTPPQGQYPDAQPNWASPSSLLLASATGQLNNDARMPRPNIDRNSTETAHSQPQPLKNSHYALEPSALGLDMSLVSEEAVRSTDSPRRPSTPLLFVSRVSSSSPSSVSELSVECERIMQAVERAVAMVEMIQWSVDQYGYMLYGIGPKFQKLLELELKLVYGSAVESLVMPTSPIASGTAASGRMSGSEPLLGSVGLLKQQALKEQGQGHETEPTAFPETAASRLGITVLGLYRWEESTDGGIQPADLGVKDEKEGGHDRSGAEETKPSTRLGLGMPEYASSVLDNARTVVQLLQELLHRYPGHPA